MGAQEAEVLVETRGTAGIITLNRPKALNALNQNMVEIMAEALERFREDDTIHLVILRGAGERSLCAGGDIAALYRDALNNGRESAKFFRDEYTLNYAISQFPKPYVAIQHGIVLGGGIGVSAHGSHRVVTDSTRVGMPETGIGFTPDVGGSYLLSHAPHNLGIHLGLTGIHVGAAEAIAVGMADTYVPEEQLEHLVAHLCTAKSAEEVDAILAEYAADPGEAFSGQQERIEAAYQGQTVAEILAALDEEEADFAADAAKRIRRNSPTACVLTLAYIRRAANFTLREALEHEFAVSNNMHAHPDFVEGVRAQIIDKDRNPKWTPAELEQVDSQQIARLLGPLIATDIEPLAL